MKMLRATDLWKQQEQQKTASMQAMRPVLSNLCSQIKMHAATNPLAPYMAYDVPSFVFGYPLYSHREAVLYVKETLEEQGFKVWISGVSTLLISWIKPGKTAGRAPAKSSGDYRPFVYDEAAMEATLSRMR
jgi:hypothetical protein